MSTDISCYQITAPDGGGMRDEHVCYAANEAVAKAIIDHLGSGWPRKATPVVFTVLDSVQDYLMHTNAALRASAARKLTAAERRVLGITEDGKHV